MKCLFLIPAIAFATLTAGAFNLVAQDAPPNPLESKAKPAQQSSGQDAATDGAAQDKAGKDNSGGVYTPLHPLYVGGQAAQQGSDAAQNPLQAASFDYLLRAYNPLQQDAAQRKAVQFLLDGYYQNYRDVLANQAAQVYTQNDSSSNAEQSLNKNPLDVYWQKYAQPNQEYNQALQKYYQANPLGTVYQDYTDAYSFLLNAQQQNVSKYWVGMQTGPLSKDVRPFLDIPEDQGVVVRSIVDDSPAEAAGLEVNDILLSLGGQTISKVADVYRIIGEIEDETAEVEVIRKGKKIKLEITAVTRPEPAEPNQDATQKFWDQIKPGVYSPYIYSPGTITWDYTQQSESAKRIEELEKQIKQLTERLEKLEKDAR